MPPRHPFAAYLIEQRWLPATAIEEYERLCDEPEAALLAFALELGHLTLRDAYTIVRDRDGGGDLGDRLQQARMLSREALLETKRAAHTHLESLEAFIRWRQLLPEPLLREALHTYRQSDPPAADPARKRRVLVIDDSAVIRRVVREGLEAHGCQVWEAASAEDGIALAESERPDLITLDLQMPEIDGFAACERLRGAPHTGDIPIIVLTVKDTVDDRHRGFDVGAVEFLSKHAAPDEIIASILEILRQLEGPKYHRVLVVDDSVFVRHALDYGLRKHGYHTVLARSGSECLRHLDTFAPDVALLDLRLPDSDGLDLLRWIKRHPTHRHMPVIVMTVVRDSAAIVDCFTAGAADYLVKPFDLGELAARVGTHVRLRDVASALERQAAQLKHLDAMKDQFYATLTHDLRSPFNAIWSPAEMLLMGTGGDLTDQQRRLVEMISKASRDAIDLIDTTLENFRAESGEIELRPQPCNFAALVEDALGGLLSETYAAGKRVVINGQASETLPRGWSRDRHPDIVMDASKAARILANLFSNALKYAESEVAITFGEMPDGVRLTVMDDGPGIPAADLPSIWELFRQADCAKPGTGLGLAIVHAYVTMHGGTVRAESREGQGAAFTVTLPDLRAWQERP